MKITKSLVQQDSLMKELGLTDLENDQQSELFSLMMDILEVKMLDALLSELDEKEQKEFTTILLTENVDEGKDFLNKRVKNLDKLLEGVVQDFKNDLLEDILEAKKQLLKK